MRRGHRRGDRGAGTMLTIALTPIVLIAIALLWVFVDLAMLRSKAAGAADLAALAGANYLLDDPDRSCAIAAEIAARNRATLESCALSGLDIIVEVSIASTGIAASLADRFAIELPRVRQRARAGAPMGP
jgi:secretion/DNA translocation related TadE-like protein